jgi:hypothetical protein
MSTSNTKGTGFGGLDKILLLLLLPGLFAAIYMAAGRIQIENSSKNVELTLDYNEIQNLSASTGEDITAILRSFKAEGVTSAAINEDTVGSLIDLNQIRYNVPSDASKPVTTIEVNDAELANRIYSALRKRLPNNCIKPPKMSGKNAVIVVNMMPESLNQISLGIPLDKVRVVEAAGLSVVGRLLNNSIISRRMIDASFNELKQYGIKHIICGGEDVVGFKKLIPYTAEKISANSMIYGSIEFAKQKGDAALCAKLKGNYVRVHSISVTEMDKMTPSTAIERFARAVRERSIRMCYLRLPSVSGDDVLSDNMDYIRSINQSIEKAGFSVGAANPFTNTARPLWAMALIVISIVSGGILLLNSTMSLSSMVKYGLLILGSIACIGIAAKAEIGYQGMALLSALIFPTLGVMTFAGPYFNNQYENGRALLKAVGIFIGASMFTLYGAAMIVGLLADRSYVVKLNQYVGIKPSAILPIMLIIFAMCAGLPIFNKSFAEVKADVYSNLRKLVSHPLFIWHVIAALGALIAIAMAVLRSGNDPGVGISSLELKFRAILDELLVVRPRTKEFMIGHPAFIIGMALLLRKNRGWGLPLAAFGMIGQTSLLNTFCHIHTPLYVSIIRTFNGLWIGLALGIILWLILDFRSNKPSKSEQ